MAALLTYLALIIITAIGLVSGAYLIGGAGVAVLAGSLCVAFAAAELRKGMRP
jgi:hypothetical protein